MNTIINSADELHALCRICLSGEKCTRDIFTDKCSDGRSYSEILTESTRIEITQGDHLPSQICDTCSMRLESHKIDDSLISKFIESNTFLNDCINNIDIINKEINEQDSNLHSIFRSDNHTYECSQCEKTFSTESDREEHAATHVEEKLYKCDICEKIFRRSHHLKTHLLTHSNEKPFKCDTCEKAFSQNIHLKIHVRTHTQERPYKCDVCKKTFRQETHLKLHARVHTQEKPYQCDVCKKSFSRKCSLNEHLRSQAHARKNVEKAHKCDECGKAYRLEGYLKLHVLTHTQKRNFFKCDVCEREFLREKPMRKHVRSHMEQKVLECDECEKICNTEEALVRHIINHVKKRDDGSIQITRRRYKRKTFLKESDCSSVHTTTFPESVYLKQENVVDDNDEHVGGRLDAYFSLQDTVDIKQETPEVNIKCEPLTEDDPLCY